jgi:hypothetical protein
MYSPNFINRAKEVPFLVPAVPGFQLRSVSRAASPYFYEEVNRRASHLEIFFFKKKFIEGAFERALPKKI